MIEWIIGCGVHAAEGNAHERQRRVRVAAPAFSIQNMRAFVPLVFQQGRGTERQMDGTYPRTGGQRYAE